MEWNQQDSLGAYFCLEVDMSVLEQYTNLAEKHVYKKGDAVGLRQGKWDHLVYLKKGRVGRIVIARNGNEKLIKVVCEESLLGEVIFFRNSNSDSSYFIAMEPCECYFFDRKTVYDVLLKDEKVVHDMLQWFASRTAALNMQIQDNMVKDPQYHVYKFLLDYTKRFGGKNEQGQLMYRGKLSHYDISKYLGINRVSVSNVMKELQDMSIIYKDRSQLIILDEFFLEQF